MVRVHCPHWARAAPAPHGFRRPVLIARFLRLQGPLMSVLASSSQNGLGCAHQDSTGSGSASWSVVTPLSGADQLAPLCPPAQA